MPSYRVQVIHRETGQETVLVVDAPSAKDACRYANDMGFLSGEVKAEQGSSSHAQSTVEAVPAKPADRKPSRIKRLLVNKANVGGILATVCLLVILAIALAMPGKSGIKGRMYVQLAGGDQQRGSDEAVFLLMQRVPASSVADAGERLAGFAMALDAGDGNLDPEKFRSYQERVAVFKGMGFDAEVALTELHAIITELPLAARGRQLRSTLYTTCDTTWESVLKGISISQTRTDINGEFFFPNVLRGKYILASRRSTSAGVIDWMIPIETKTFGAIEQDLTNSNAIKIRSGNR